MSSDKKSVDKTFSDQCAQLYCADEESLKQTLYRIYSDIPPANPLQLAEVNQLIHQQHDWFLDILQQYKLNSKEGMLLMSLAEALVRIPDQESAQALFHDRLHRGSWLKKECKNTLLAKALQWLGDQTPIDPSTRNSLFKKVTQQGAIEVCTLFIEQMSQRFIFAENLEDALLRSRKLDPHEACSFDMLGEAALTFEESENYFSQYQEAIIQVGEYNQCLQDTPHEVSVKLSALHPRYQPEKFDQLKQQLLPKLLLLCDLAQKNNVLLTFDAEEQYRLELSIKIIKELLTQLQSSSLLQGFGIAVQAYGKRGLSVIEELKSLSRVYDFPITVRLVKGAYWDSEIKSAQQLGLTDYPVWSQKQLTDDYFLMCAHSLLTPGDHNLRAQFASHNPETLLQVQKIHEEYSNNKKQSLKLQRLHGMGEIQHAFMAETFNSNTRVYCPIGARKKLLPYLVRRLIENGANTSFLYPQYAETSDLDIPPILIKKPGEIFDYKNSDSFDIRQDHNFFPLYASVQTKKLELIKQKSTKSDRTESVLADKNAIQYTAQVAYVSFHTLLSADKRIECLNTWADKLLEQQDELIALLILQAGKTYQDAIDEIREASDFCRYYAKQAQRLFNSNDQRPSITGELNQLQYKGKGIAVCISPWNFPLAIFVGQIAATWVAGNSVIAKPAQQTLSIAKFALDLAYDSGIDRDQIQLLHCQGSDLLPSLLEQDAVQLVCFTGSTHTAKSIQRTLANSSGPIIRFIAETGGQNVLIADSSALLDQLIPDIVQSAFHCAGQRCSALRVAYIQEDIFKDFCLSLKGHMKTLKVGDPSERDTDIGPIIDRESVDKLQQHIDWLDTNSKLIARCPESEPLSESADKDLSARLLTPCAYQIESIMQIKEENFGPILHVIPFSHNDIQQVLADINHTGYGLTMGLHSRNQDWLDQIIGQVSVGNIYINRNMVGAKVSSQPFGGHGLSGTGPKAGGPNYLSAMVDEHVVTTNITAWGGNPELL